MFDKSSADLQAERVEARLAIPVLASALVSVPAVFLTTAGGTAALIGTVLNWLSLSVLVGESVILLWVSRDLMLWVRRYRAHLLVLAATVPAVVFAVGPVQILRLLLSLGAFQVFRAGRILRAGRIIRSKFSLRGRRGTWLLVGMTMLAAVFVAIVLSNPDSRSREVISWVIERYGVLAALALLGVLALAATLFLVLRRRRNRESATTR